MRASVSQIPLDTKVIEQQSHIADIGLKGDVKEIAQKRHRASDSVDRHVPAHLVQKFFGSAELTGAVDDVDGNQRRERIACTRNKPNQSIEAKADVGSGKDKGVVEKAREVD